MKQLVLVIALLIAASMSFAQVQGDFDFTANVATSGGPLTVAVSQGALWDALRPGISYQCIADNPVNTTNITPIDVNNQEAYAPGIVDITGSAGAQVVVTFILPTKLYPSAGIGSVTMTYDNQSASVVDLQSTGLPVVFFNPLTPQTVTIDAAGTAEIFIGGNPSVSADATDGDAFMGYGIMTAEYVGM